MTAIVHLLWATGCRLNEICSLTLDDLEDQGDCFALTISDAKTEAGNRVVFFVHPIEVERLRKTILLSMITKPDTPDNAGLLFPRIRRGGFDRKPSWYVGKGLEKARKIIVVHDGSCISRIVANTQRSC